MAKPHLARLGVALLPVGIVAALLLANASSAENAWASDEALETALLAPCCYNGTLLTHDSPVAHDLRVEIKHRHESGESLSRIEKDMVLRYGDKVLAMPNQNRFVSLMGVALAAAVLAAGLLVVGIRQLRGAESKAKTRSVEKPPRDVWDDRIDEELMSDQTA